MQCKKPLLILLAALILTSTYASAAEPTRGFIIERGTTAHKGDANLDLAVGNHYKSGGVRLGLGNGEIILDSKKIYDDTQKTDGIFKYSLTQFMEDPMFNLAVYGGGSYYDKDGGSDDYSYLSLTVGAAATTAIQNFILSADAAFVHDNRSSDHHRTPGYPTTSKNYVTLGGGVHYKIADTAYGSFQPGGEIEVSSASHVDPMIALGARWQFNDRITLDVLPFTSDIKNNDTLTAPGQLRLSATF